MRNKSQWFGVLEGFMILLPLGLACLLGLNITVLNIQSYPTVGGLWQVDFNTTGTADLHVSAVNGTVFGEDLLFQGIYCGDTLQDSMLVGDSYVVRDYSCSVVGREVSKVLSKGKHTLRFQFGDKTAHAFNSAGWWNSSWTRKAPIDINTSTALTDYQVYINVTYDSDMNNNFSDIRFTNEEENVSLDYWIESKTDGSHADVWIEVDSIDTNNGTQAYLYYGNSGAISTGSGASTFLFFDGFDDFEEILPHPTTYQHIPTYDGSNQTVHPDVEYNGSIFAMCVTPFPDSNVAYENPSVYKCDGNCFSATGNWTNTTGNPIASQPTGGHNADCDIVWDNTSKIWWSYWIADRNSYLEIYRSSSTDLYTWSARQLVMNNTGVVWGLSPTIDIINQTWYMWCNNDSVSKIVRWNSSDGLSWSTPTNTNIDGWHQEIQYIPSKSKYWALIDDNTLPTWFSTSNDGLTWTLPTYAILGRGMYWDDANDYRGGFFYNTSADILHVWYSAKSQAGKWHTGYTSQNYTLLSSQMGGGDFWLQKRKDSNLGSIIKNSTRIKHGNASLMFGATGRQDFHKNSTITRPYIIEWDMYDDNDTSAMKLFRLKDSGNPIGFGVWTSTSSTNYSKHNDAYGYSATGIQRTLGWRKFKTVVNSSGDIEFFVDDVDAGTLSSQLGDLVSLNLATHSFSTTIWFDGIRIRKYTSSEPLYSIGGEEAGNSAPQITLNYPADNSTGVSISPTINITVIDADNDTMNITFYNTSNNVAICTNNSIANGTKVLCTWAGASSYSTTYDWYVNITDGTDMTTSPTWNFTTLADAIPPTVTLAQPSNGYNVSNTEINFTCKASDPEGNLQNLSLYINYSGVWEINATDFAPIDNVNSEFTVSGMATDQLNNIWSCYACDSFDNCAFASVNRTFGIDRTDPVHQIEMVNPTSDVVNSTFELYSNFSESGTGVEYQTIQIDTPYGTITETTYDCYDEGGGIWGCYLYCNATGGTGYYGLCNTTHVGSYNWTDSWVYDSVGNSEYKVPDYVGLQFNVTPLNTAPNAPSITFLPVNIYTNTTKINSTVQISDINNDNMNVTAELFNGTTLLKLCSWNNQADGTTLTCNSTNRTLWVKGNTLNWTWNLTDTSGDTSFNSTTKVVANTLPNLLSDFVLFSLSADGSVWNQLHNASDDDTWIDGIDTLQWYDNNSLWDININTGLMSHTPLESEWGMYYTRVNVTDGTAWSTDDFVFRIKDVTEPNTTSVSIIPTSILINGSVLINATIIDPGIISIVSFYIQTPYGNLNLSHTANSTNNFWMYCNETNTCKTNMSGQYNLTTVWANDTSNNTNWTIHTLNFNVSATDTTAPNCTIVSQIPGNVNHSSNGSLVVKVHCEDATGFNLSALGIGLTINHSGNMNSSWRFLSNTKADGYLDMQRAEHRNESDWYESLFSNIWEWSFHEAGCGHIDITYNGTCTAGYCVNFTFTKNDVHTLFHSFWPLDKDSLENSKMNYLNVYKNNNAVSKIYLPKLEANATFTIHSYINDTDHIMDAFGYLCNSSKEADGISTPSSSNCQYFGSIDRDDNFMYCTGNACYHEFSIFIDENMTVGGVKVEEEMFVIWTSEASVGKPWKFGYSDNTTLVGNVSFNNTGLFYTSSDNGQTFTAHNGTGVVWASAVHDVVDILTYKIYSRDNATAKTGGWSGLTKDSIGVVPEAPGTPAIIHINGDTNKNGTYGGVFDMGCELGSDPNNEPVTGNLSLCNLDGSWNYTINGSFTDGGGIINISFNSSLVNDGIYKLNLTNCDNTSRCTSILTTTNFTIDNTNLVIAFISSSTTTAGTHSQNYIEANVSANDTNLDIVSITLYNSTRGVIQTNTSAVSPFFVNFTGLTENTYYLNATANDTAGNLNYTETRTIILANDTTSPIIYLETPATGFSTTDDTPAFVFNVSETSGCTLYIAGINRSSNSSVTANYSTTLTSTDLSAGTFSWYINCTDLAGNTNQSGSRSITITSEASEGGAGGGGGGGTTTKKNFELLEAKYYINITENTLYELPLELESKSIKDYTLTIYEMSSSCIPQELNIDKNLFIAKGSKINSSNSTILIPDKSLQEECELTLRLTSGDMYKNIVYQFRILEKEKELEMTYLSLLNSRVEELNNMTVGEILILFCLSSIGMCLLLLLYKDMRRKQEKTG